MPCRPVFCQLESGIQLSDTLTKNRIKHLKKSLVTHDGLTAAKLGID